MNEEKADIASMENNKGYIKESYCYIQKQPARCVFRKRCSENIQQIYRRTPMPKCDFNKVAKQLYSNRTLAWVFSCKFAAYFQNTSEGLLLYISESR